MNQRFANGYFRIIVTVSLLAILSSCKPENLKEGAQMEYFDVSGYFKRTAAQMDDQHSTIEKTVIHNGTAETRQVQISDWESEFGLFTESDINKPAWKGSYTTRDSAGAIVYTAKEADLKTRKVIIEKNAKGVVKRLYINNIVDNTLYTSHEELEYFPDSVYQITKYQKVKLLGANTYKITGRF